MTPTTKVALTKLALSLIDNAQSDNVAINEARKGYYEEAKAFYGNGDGDPDDYDDDEGDRAAFLKDRKAIFNDAIRALDNTIDHPEDCEGDLTEFERG